jgi:hypothetical protein
MMSFRKKMLAGSAATAMSLAGMGGFASAQITQDGLVNVAADGVNVQIPISAAANICGVGVAVLATATDLGDVECTTEGVALAENDNRNRGGNTRQNGLVNVALTDINAQVPVTVAASVCGVAVGVLAQAEDLGDVTCTAEGVSLAQN